MDFLNFIEIDFVGLGSAVYVVTFHGKEIANTTGKAIHKTCDVAKDVFKIVGPIKLDEEYFKLYLGSNTFTDEETGKKWKLNIECEKIRVSVHKNLWEKIKADINQDCSELLKRRNSFNEYNSQILLTDDEKTEASDNLRLSSIIIARKIAKISNKYGKLPDDKKNFILGKKEQLQKEQEYEWFSQELKQECEMMTQSLDVNKETINV